MRDFELGTGAMVWPIAVVALLNLYILAFQRCTCAQERLNAPGDALHGFFFCSSREMCLD